MSESKVRVIISYVVGVVFGALAYLITEQARRTLHAPPAISTTVFGALTFVILAVGYCALRFPDFLNHETIELRKATEEEAKKLILDLIKRKPNTRTSDIIIKLKLDPELVVKTLDELKKEGKIKGKDIP